jgi:hypothetical protein
LVTPAEANRVVDRPDYDTSQLAVRARLVEVADGVPLDTCVYAGVPRSSDPLDLGALQVSVSAIPRRPDRITGFTERSEAVPRLGDEAYIEPGDFVTKVLVRRGNSQVVVEALLDTVARQSSRARRAELLDLVRRAVERLPTTVTIAGAAAEPPCTRVSARTVAEVLAQPIAMSRTFRTDDSLVCAYSATHDAQVVVTVERKPSADRLEYARFSIREADERLRQGGLDGAWRFGMFSAVSDGAILTVRVNGIDYVRADEGPSPEELALARASARALLR